MIIHLYSFSHKIFLYGYSGYCKTPCDKEIIFQKLSYSLSPSTPRRRFPFNSFRSTRDWMYWALRRSPLRAETVRDITLCVRGQANEKASNNLKIFMFASGRKSRLVGEKN
ncbi:hypothetical protein J6590_053194 [Homalodisca vitripennis]|nr:hypothetical protein J6590_053194 [Homalodisca vitripennis]